MGKLMSIPRDIFRGEDCIVIGNGLSLANVPFDLLKSMKSFGSNGIYMLPDFTPDFYSVIGFNHLDTAEKRQVVKEVIPNVCAAFINRLFIQYFRADSIGYRNVYSVLSGGPVERGGFSFRPLEYVGVNATITYISLQLAYWMGFHRVYLVGIDHDYTSVERHFYPDWSRPEFPVEERSIEDGEEVARRADTAYKAAKVAFRKDGRHILNLTRNWSDTSTDVFPDIGYPLP